MRIFCDFDGTISIQDATDLILSRFASPDWERIEEEWKQGAIGSQNACSARWRSFAQPSAIGRCVDEIDIDPSFPALPAFVAHGAFPSPS